MLGRNLQKDAERQEVTYAELTIDGRVRRALDKRPDSGSFFSQAYHADLSL